MIFRPDLLASICWNADIAVSCVFFPLEWDTKRWEVIWEALRIDYLAAVELGACFLEDLSYLTLTQFVSCACAAFCIPCGMKTFFRWLL